MSNASGIFSTNTRERVKGLIIAIVGAIITALYQTFNDVITGNGKFPTTLVEWQSILGVAISAGIAAGFLYLGVTFGTNGNKPNAIEKAIKKDNTQT